MTIFQRYVFKNHTFRQLLVGSVLGVAIAYLTIYLEDVIKNLEDPDKNIYLLLKN
jgi:membrane-associated phospholipid phosphatase